MTGKTFLKPGTDPATGSSFRVYLPAKGRDIAPAGESMLVDAYIERRILSGELVRAQPEELSTDTTTSAPPTTGRRNRSAATDTPSPGV